MSASARIEALLRMLGRRPDDPRILFGLALESLGADDLEGGVRYLQQYLARADDEGNAWGRLAEVLLRLGRTGEAREAWSRGIEAAHRHGHPTMVEAFEEALRAL